MLHSDWPERPRPSINFKALSGIPGRSSTQNARQRRAALATAEQNEETNMRRQVEKILTEKEHLFVLHPHSSVRFYWDLASIIILLINVVTIPLGEFFGSFQTFFLNSCVVFRHCSA